jgi:hypothetical protein
VMVKRARYSLPGSTRPTPPSTRLFVGDVIGSRRRWTDQGTQTPVRIARIASQREHRHRRRSQTMLAIKTMRCRRFVPRSASLPPYPRVVVGIPRSSSSRCPRWKLQMPAARSEPGNSVRMPSRTHGPLPGWSDRCVDRQAPVTGGDGQPDSRKGKAGAPTSISPSGGGVALNEVLPTRQPCCPTRPWIGSLRRHATKR